MNVLVRVTKKDINRAKTGTRSGFSPFSCTRGERSQGPTLHEHVVSRPSLAAETLEMTWFCIGKHVVSPISPPEPLEDTTNQSFPPSPGALWEGILAHHPGPTIRALLETP